MCARCSDFSLCEPKWAAESPANRRFNSRMAYVTCCTMCWRFVPRCRERQVADFKLGDDWCRKRVKGIEPSPKAWEAFVLPLNYTRDDGLTVATTPRRVKRMIVSTTQRIAKSQASFAAAQPPLVALDPC
jgi:hypothetical protein